MVKRTNLQAGVARALEGSAGSFYNQNGGKGSAGQVTAAAAAAVCVS